MIKVKQKGDFGKITRYFVKIKDSAKLSDLKKYGERGVYALTVATPIDTGRTAVSWSYKIVPYDGGAAIEFHNANIQNGVPIAIILQYGHATKNGHWVQGRDYINPAIQYVFDEMVEEAWKEVTQP